MDGAIPTSYVGHDREVQREARSVGGRRLLRKGGTDGRRRRRPRGPRGQSLGRPRGRLAAGARRRAGGRHQPAARLAGLLPLLRDRSSRFPPPAERPEPRPPRRPVVLDSSLVLQRGAGVRECDRRGGFTRLSHRPGRLDGMHESSVAGGDPAAPSGSWSERRCC